MNLSNNSIVKLVLLFCKSNIFILKFSKENINNKVIKFINIYAFLFEQ